MIACGLRAWLRPPLNKRARFDDDDDLTAGGKESGVRRARRRQGRRRASPCHARRVACNLQLCGAARRQRGDTSGRGQGKPNGNPPGPPGGFRNNESWAPVRSAWRLSKHRKLRGGGRSRASARVANKVREEGRRALRRSTEDKQMMKSNRQKQS